jgi:hypothetical protein
MLCIRNDISVAPTILLVAWVVSAASAGAQDVRTQAPCSPVIDRTQGNAIVSFSGACTVGFTPAELKNLVEIVLTQGSRWTATTG